MHHLVRITPLTQKPHAHTNSSVLSISQTSFTVFPSTTKAPQVSQFLLLFFSCLCSKLLDILSCDYFWQDTIPATFLKCGQSVRPAHTKRQTHRHTVYIQEAGLIYSTCSQCPLCDIYRNMGTSVIGNPDCGFEVDSWLSAVQCVQMIVDGEPLHNNLPLLHVEQPLSCFGNN